MLAVYGCKARSHEAVLGMLRDMSENNEAEERCGFATRTRLIDKPWPGRTLVARRARNKKGPPIGSPL